MDKAFAGRRCARCYESTKQPIFDTKQLHRRLPDIWDEEEWAEMCGAKAVPYCLECYLDMLFDEDEVMILDEDGYAIAA